jgi:hypothetical protein
VNSSSPALTVRLYSDRYKFPQHADEARHGVWQLVKAYRIFDISIAGKVRSIGGNMAEAGAYLGAAGGFCLQTGPRCWGVYRPACRFSWCAVVRLAKTDLYDFEPVSRETRKIRR